MASRGVNKVILVGNLGDFPEIRYSQSQEVIASFSVATSEVWKDKQTGEPQERTEWHRISAFGALAEICGKFLQKGTKVYCEGTLQTRKWTDQQGIERYTTQVRLNELQILANGIMLGEQQGNPNPVQTLQGGAPHASQHAGAPQPPGNYYQRTNRAGPPPDARYNQNGTQISPYANVTRHSPPVGPIEDDIPF